MRTRELAGLLATAALLLAAAWVVRSQALWNPVASLTVAWLCSALGIGVLVVTAASLLAGSPLHAVPLRPLAALCGALVGVLGVGLVVDSLYLGELRLLPSALGEWIGFTVLLGAVVVAARLGRPPAES